MCKLTLSVGARVRALSTFTMMLATLACAHVPRPVPTFGFAARQCERVREVKCLNTPVYRAVACLADAAWAVARINEAVGREVLRVAGTVDPTQLADPRPLVVFGAPLKPPLLGATFYNTEVSSTRAVCVRRTGVALAPGAFAPPYDVRLVLLHELVHALGAGHAESEAPQAAYASRMEPIYRAALDVPLTAGDVAALRSVYGD